MLLLQSTIGVALQWQAPAHRNPALDRHLFVETEDTSHIGDGEGTNCSWEKVLAWTAEGNKEISDGPDT